MVGIGGRRQQHAVRQLSRVEEVLDHVDDPRAGRTFDAAHVGVDDTDAAAAQVGEVAADQLAVLSAFVACGGPHRLAHCGWSAEGPSECDRQLAVPDDVETVIVQALQCLNGSAIKFFEIVLRDCHGCR